MNPTAFETAVLSYLNRGTVDSVTTLKKKTKINIIMSNDVSVV